MANEIVKHKKHGGKTNNGRDEKGWWQAGYCPNPKGRPPKGYSIREMFRDMFSKDPQVKIDFTYAIYAKAMSGDVQAQRLIWNYVEGMPTEDIKVTGDGITAVPITIAYIKPDKKQDEPTNTPDQHIDQANT